MTDDTHDTGDTDDDEREERPATAGETADADAPAPGDDPDPWPVLESRTEYETDWYTGGYDLARQPNGTEKRYYWADLPPAAVVVPRVDDRLVMVKQYRPVIREHCLELPAGIVEERESFTEAGARELREETGFDPQGTSLLEAFHCATGVLRHRRGIVFAEGLEPVERRLDGNEFLAVTTVPVDEALDRARASPANDATIEGILLARAEGLL